MADLKAQIKAQVDAQLYERLRREAYDSRRSISQIVAIAVENYLDDLDQDR